VGGASAGRGREREQARLGARVGQGEHARKHEPGEASRHGAGMVREQAHELRQEARVEAGSRRGERAAR
jgi:hypothetical protein